VHAHINETQTAQTLV